VVLKTALVTGASGFIGKALCRYLQQQGWHVRGTYRSGELIDGVEPVLFDLNNRSWPEGLTDGVDVIFHLAGKAHVIAADWQDEEEYLPVNTASTRKLLLAAQKSLVPRFVYFSTVKAIGNSHQSMCIDENDTTLPQGPYGISKYMAEQLVLNGGYVPEPVVIRPTMVYGNTMKGNLPNMIRAITNHRFPPIPEFANRRSMVHVDDIIRAALLMAEHPNATGRVYIVSDGETYSTHQIYRWICEALGRKPSRWSVPASVFRLLAKLGDGLRMLVGRRIMYDSDVLEKLSGSACYCSEQVGIELGFKPERRLDEALPEIVRFLEASR